MIPAPNCQMLPLSPLYLLQMHHPHMNVSWNLVPEIWACEVLGPDLLKWNSQGAEIAPLFKSRGLSGNVKWFFYSWKSKDITNLLLALCCIAFKLKIIIKKLKTKQNQQKNPFFPVPLVLQTAKSVPVTTLLITGRTLPGWRDQCRIILHEPG